MLSQFLSPLNHKRKYERLKRSSENLHAKPGSSTRKRKRFNVCACGYARRREGGEGCEVESQPLTLSHISFNRNDTLFTYMTTIFTLTKRYAKDKSIPYKIISYAVKHGK